MHLFAHGNPRGKQVFKSQVFRPLAQGYTAGGPQSLDLNLSSMAPETDVEQCLLSKINL